MIKLLLVEDDASLRYIVQGGLEDMIGGYEVIAAANGEEGLKQWKEQHPDVIVSDIEMPVMNGYEMVKRIRETDGETPILFSSALISPKDVVKGYEIGANNYIKKPFIPEELDAHVHALLKLSKGEKSKDTSQCYKIGKEYVLDATHATLKHASGVNKTLTVRETGLLQMLCEKRGDVIRRAIGFELVNQLIDLFFRADIYATGRLIEDQHFGACHQTTGNRHFLLIATGEQTNCLFH